MNRTRLSWSAPIPRDDLRHMAVGASAGLLSSCMLAGLIVLVLNG